MHNATSTFTKLSGDATVASWAGSVGVILAVLQLPFYACLFCQLCGPTFLVIL